MRTKHKQWAVAAGLLALGLLLGLKTDGSPGSAPAPQVGQFVLLQLRVFRAHPDGSLVGYPLDSLLDSSTGSLWFLEESAEKAPTKYKWVLGAEAPKPGGPPPTDRAPQIGRFVWSQVNDIPAAAGTFKPNILFDNGTGRIWVLEVMGAEKPPKYRWALAAKALK